MFYTFCCGRTKSALLWEKLIVTFFSNNEVLLMFTKRSFFIVSLGLFSLHLQATEKMTIDHLRSEAFLRCQSHFQRPTIVPIPVLDPPSAGGIESVGMTYQEELAIRSKNFLDKDDFYISPRPRAAVNSLPMDVYVDNDNSGVYVKKTWEDAQFDYTAHPIWPPIDQSALPAEGKVLTEVIFGHRSPQGDYPQLFDLRSSAYVRFAGFPPQVTGASLRLGAHGIFGKGADEANVQEDFPIIRSVYLSTLNRDTAHAYILLESELFCGAISMEMSPKNDNAEIVVDSFWYTREDFNWKNDPHTGLVAYSSMFWRNEHNAPSISGEAHDSDMMTVKYSNGKEERFPIQPPVGSLRIRDLTLNNEEIQEWILANEDRDPTHYADFYPALRETNYDKRASYNVKILASNIKTGVSLYEAAADGEYGDNIVAVSTIRQDIKKAKSPSEFIHFKYITTAFYPEK
jgi:hypothetical protein